MRNPAGLAFVWHESHAQGDPWSCQQPENRLQLLKSMQRKEECPLCPSEEPGAAPAQPGLPGKGAAGEGQGAAQPQCFHQAGAPAQAQDHFQSFGSLLLQWDLSNTTSLTLPGTNKSQYSTLIHYNRIHWLPLVNSDLQNLASYTCISNMGDFYLQAIWFAWYWQLCSWETKSLNNWT